MDGQPLPTTLAVPQDGYAYLIAAAIDKGMTVESMGKLLELEEKYRAGKAREAFNKAMNQAQAQMPVVLKNKTNTHTKSRYADLAKVIQTITPIYTAFGFSLSFSTAKSELTNHIRIVCNCMHDEGHTQAYAGDFPLDGAGMAGGTNKTGVQATGSTFSYGRRYLTFLIFNLATDDDTDGNDANRKISPDQIGEINDVLAKCDKVGVAINYPAYLQWLKVESLDQLPITEFGRAVHYLTMKLEAKKR